MSHSAWDKMEILAKEYVDSAYKVISINFLESVKKGEFKKQKQLAEECFVSESTVTKFAKHLGFSGYRELLFYFKNEIDDFYNNQNTENEGTIFSPILNWISMNNSNIKTICENILSAGDINILSSYQTKSSAKFLYEVLSNLNFRPYFLNHNLNPFWKNESSKQEKLGDFSYNIVFFMGPDNNCLMDTLNLLEKNMKNQKFLIFSSEKQSQKLSLKNSQILKVNLKGVGQNFVIRTTALHMLILEIYKAILKTTN
ncbi:hypothetical protein [Mesoplasma coleopterae]|uniref:HTH rpiR-type domain-containing protein n=1 Tax=Mesoplasma coleopterae TaxID=324078 RepID=A0A2K8P184_9MOLU|nr:hypothetical protein [Mesoplasma coleopterae]ATZ20527.1 hypothetical protein MCOLE_v1c00120 [Mesoplasma coleopterae]